MSWNKTNRIHVTIIGDNNGRKIGAENFSFWSNYQDRMYIEDYPNGWVGDHAIILGHTSDYLCCLDFDDHEHCGQNKFEEFKNSISAEILDKMSIEETSNNGVHAYFRTELLEKKRVIAKSENNKNTIELLAGKGCLVFCSYPGSKYYKQVSEKCIEEADFLTDAEVFELIKVCEGINEYVDDKDKLTTTPVKKSDGSITILGNSGIGQADFLRGIDGINWLKQILAKQGWNEIGDKTSSDGRNYTAYAHPNASNPNKPSISLFDDTGVYCHSQDVQKNQGLEGGTNYSVYQAILTIEFNGDTKAMSRAFYERFPEFHNKLSYLSVNQLSIYDELFGDQKEENNDEEEDKNNTFDEKDKLLKDIIADPDYAILASHINNASKNAAVKMPFGYLLSGLALVGCYAYRGFVDETCDMYEDNNDKPHAETSLSIVLTAPSGSGKNNVLNSLKCYADKMDEFIKGKGDGDAIESYITQLPSTQRGLQQLYCTGYKNLCLYQDEYQDFLGEKKAGDLQNSNMHKSIKELVCKDDKTYRINGSSTFNRTLKELEKEFGRSIDYDWWRLSQFNVGTEQAYCGLTDSDENGGFARRYLWFNERRKGLVRLNFRTVSNRVTPDTAFIDFLKAMASIRDNGLERVDYPVVSICYPKEVEDLANKYNEENYEYTIRDMVGSCPLRESFALYINRLSKIFAIIRGEWISYDGDCVETIGDDVQLGIGTSSVGKRVINVKPKDVELAWRLFNISCYDYYFGSNAGTTVSNTEKNTKKLEKQILSICKMGATLNKIIEKMAPHSSQVVKTLVDSLLATHQLFKFDDSARIFNQAGYKKELEKRENLKNKGSK